MAKVFNSFEKVAIKNAAKAIAAIQTKQEKLRKNIADLEGQIAAHDVEITVFEESVKGITGGYAPTELCRKEVRESGKQADWVFVYPDTIVPPTNDDCPIVEHPETEEEAVAPFENSVEQANDNVLTEAPTLVNDDSQVPLLEEPDPMDDIFKD